MKKFMVIAAIFLLSYPIIANALLIDRGEGMIYDTDSNLTWLQDANIVGVRLDWYRALDWADQLEYGGFDDWRLPSAGDNPIGGFESESEMGNLYYNVLGNSSGNNSFTNSGPFLNIQEHRYWTGTMFDGAGPVNAWQYIWLSGYQNNTLIGSPGAFMMAVRVGDYNSPVPEPATVFLLGFGLSGVYFRFRKRRIRRQ